MKSDEGWSCWLTKISGNTVLERRQISPPTSRLEALAVLKREFVKELLMLQEDMFGAPTRS
jgi:hypothetical protein